MKVNSTMVVSAAIGFLIVLVLWQMVTKQKLLADGSVKTSFIGFDDEFNEE